MNYVLGYQNDPDKSVGPELFYWYYNIFCDHFPLSFRTFYAWVPLWGPTLALLHLSRSRIMINERRGTSFSSYRNTEANTQDTETSNPIRIRQSLQNQSSLSSSQNSHNTSASPTTVSSNSFLSTPLMNTPGTPNAQIVPPNESPRAQDRKERLYQPSEQESQSNQESPYTSSTPQSRSPATYSLSPIMRTIRFFTGTSNASSVTSMTPNSQQPTLTPQSNPPIPAPPSSSPFATRNSASANRGSTASNQTLTSSRNSAGGPPAVSYRSNGVAVYHPPPSSLFKSHYMEPDAVYEDDEEGFHSSNDRSSGASYLTRSAYDSRFNSTNSVDEDVMSSLNQLHQQHIREDLENQNQQKSDGVRNLNDELMNEDGRNIPEGDVAPPVSPPLSTMQSVPSGYSDYQSEIISEEDIDNSLLAEQYAARIPASVFTQNSGHLSVHNLLRISSVDSDWDKDEENKFRE